MLYMWIGVLGLLMGLWYIAPLLRPAKNVLPVVLISPEKLSFARLKRLLHLLQRQHFQTVVPSQIIAGKLPARPVLLLLPNGYQTYIHLLPLLEEYDSKMAIGVPVQYIGQYDGWKKRGPWQNILTAAQLQTLQKSKRVEIVSQAMNHTSLDTLNQEQLLWQLQESKTRLQTLYKLSVCACLVISPRTAARWTDALKTIYPLYIFCQTGANPLPLPDNTLRIFPLKHMRFLTRFTWKLSR